ncbi:MAG: hypothetical protein J1G02_04100 [Clostridiales bacterium]|nr:hypothetical protein [Clostridiales bacterium]
MKNNFVTILDFGSGKITCMAASKLSDNGEFIIKAVGQANYSGFDENGFFEPSMLESAVSQAISQVEGKIKCDVKEIYVGVPGAFCSLLTSEASTTFHSRKKIDQDDIDELVKKADIYKSGDDFAYLSGKPVYFILDGAIKTYDPLGAIANKLTALVSFSFMKRAFRNTIAPILVDRGINRVNYINACEAQAGYLSSFNMREGYSIVIDIGYITTNVMLSGGKGLLFQRTFALGSGYFASDLRLVIGCDFEHAMAALEKVNLNLEVKPGDAYSINGRAFEASQTNGAVKERIAQIADYIIRSFQTCDKEIPANTPIILTGGGLAYLRGGVDCLSQHLGKRVQLYTSVNPQTNRNEYTSSYGLIYEAITSNKNKNKGGFFSFLSKIGKGDK